MSIISRFLNIYYSKRNSQIDKFRRDPLKVVEERYKYIISSLATTAYGVRLGVKEGISYQQFASLVPIVTYEDYSENIEQVLAGNWREIALSKPNWYAKSSGTTNAMSKFIPTSDEALKNIHMLGINDVAAIYTYLYPSGRAFDGKILTLGGSLLPNEANGGGMVGDLSGILISNTPKIANLRRFPSSEIALDSDFERKIAKITSMAANYSITSFAGVPSWYLILMNHILDYTGKSNMCEVWNDIDLFAHGGMSFAPYKEEYKRLFPSDDMKYIETYNASEGFFAIQDDPLRDDMLLMLDYGIFYEFLECSYLDDHSKAVPLSGIEVGKNYAMIISTSGGLWRYMIGDTVMFTSTSPYRIKVTGRTKHFINIAGEEVIVDNAEQAIECACKMSGAVVSEYTAAPIFMEGREKGGHEWIFEFSTLPKSIKEFTEILDTTIQRLNSDYYTKRVGGALNPPKIVVAKEGTFYSWMKYRGKLGGQNKIPRLSNDRKYVDSLLKFTT